MDVASLFGCFLASASVIGAQIFGGGELLALLQPGAVWIVVIGTWGAVMLSFPMKDLLRALSAVPSIFVRVDLDSKPVVEDIVRIALIARKEGVLAVEGSRASIRDPLFQRTIKYVIDGFEAATVKEIIDSEIDLLLQAEERAAHVFEAAGAYAPTVGIIGAVLGLIQVMGLLSEPAKLGAGISVAFVSVLYGLALSNLVFLPVAAKLRRNAAERVRARQVVRLGVTGILEGLNPQFLKERLEVLIREAGR